MSHEPGLHHYAYFYEQSCGLWNKRSADGPLACPVLRAQLHVQPLQSEAIYYPEPITGDPRSSVWMMGINPGGGQLDDAFQDMCPNTLDQKWRSMDLAAYHSHHLRFYEHGRSDRMYRIGDEVLAGLREGGVPKQGTDAQAAWRSFAVLNVVHCKCPSWSRPVPSFGWAEVEEKLWTACGKETFEMLAYWQPRLAFCVRADVLEHWLPWFAGRHADVSATVRGGMYATTIHWKSKKVTDLLKCWSRGRWPSHRAMADSVALALDRLHAAV